MPQVISICVLLEKKGDYNMLEVYISDKTLEKIWLEYPDSNWGKILSQLRVIYISEEQTNEYLNEDGVLWQIQMAGIQLEPSTAYIQGIINGTESISEKPFGVFILDIDPAQALKMQKENGVICMSSYKIDEDILTLIDPSSKMYDEGEMGDWKEVLGGVNASSFISNSLIINDRNLFANDGYKTNRKGEKYEDKTAIYNITEMLNEIIPFTLAKPYHISVVCDYECISNGLTHKSIAEKVNKIKRALDRPFPIEIEILFIKRGDRRITDATHNRRIISNYFILKADHKICAFKPCNEKQSVSICGQNISIDKLYSRGLFDKSDPPAKGYKSDLTKYRNIIKILTEGENNGFTNYYLGQNGQEKPITELKNRLLV